MGEVDRESSILATVGDRGSSRQEHIAGVTSRSRQGKVQHAAGRRRFALRSVGAADRNR
jgi:hypothetical protein